MNKVRLGDVATYINGYAFKPADRGSVGLPIIRIQDLTGNAYDLGFYDGEYPERIEINNGDVLISWSASLGVYVWNKGKALLNQHIFKVVFDKIEIDKQFFVYAVEHSLQKMVNQTHGATMKHIIKKDFDNTLIPYPSLEQQKSIAKLLDKTCDLIEKMELQASLLDELIKSRFVEMFGDPVSNSNNFIIRPLMELGELSRGVSKHRPRNDPKLLGGKYPLIQTGDVANADLYLSSYHYTYSELGLRQSKMWAKGTLCITIAANIAKTAILAFDSCFPDSVVAFNSGKETNNIFMHYWFSFFQLILERQAPESAQKNINLQILSELKVIVPPIKLQNQFADFVTQVKEQKATVQQSIDKLETLKKSLMQEYFG